MDNRLYVIAFDTSNYKTSVAAIHRNGNIEKDLRQFLKVEKGNKGLRQSDALFQHMDNLPRMIREVFSGIKGEEVAAIAASDKPRQIQGSYMPCFKGGTAFGSALASALDVPFYTFSHQEGHLEAIKENSTLKYDTRYLALHLSGGTTEIVKVDGAIHIIGGSKDISFGQVLDRAGVLLGMDFPCGEEMDAIATKWDMPGKLLKPIPMDGSYINLSGLDTQVKRTIETYKINSSLTEEFKNGLIKEIFDRIAQSLIQIILVVTKREGIHRVLMAGGVSSSEYIKSKLTECFKDSEILIDFGYNTLASDNAVGIGYLGRKTVWPENQ